MSLVTSIIIILIIATSLSCFATFGSSCILAVLEHRKIADIVGNIAGYLGIGLLFEIAAALTYFVIDSLIK